MFAYVNALRYDECLKCNGYHWNSLLSVTMVKVSISLPNNTQITFESEESEVLHEIVAMALRDLPRELMQPGTPNVEDVSTGKGKDNAQSTVSTTSWSEPLTSITPQKTKPKSDSVTTATSPKIVNNQITDSGYVPVPPEFLSGAGRAAFEAFCQKANPLGDMRRVVVAAEGATRHFGVDGVSATDLEWLFDAAGWRRPGNFTQTLRNAARSKFGWLERIPGRSGRYAATPLGISKTIPII